MNPALVLAALLRLQLWAPDVQLEYPVARTERLQEASAAISAAAGQSREMAAALLTLGEAEARFAAYVGTGRCHEGPRGARCDRGKARTYWQLHEAACRSAWAAEPGSRAETFAGAQCAANLLRYGRWQCGSWQGAFNVYAGRRCSDNRGQAAQRAARMSQILSWL